MEVYLFKKKSQEKESDWFLFFNYYSGQLTLSHYFIQWKTSVIRNSSNQLARGQCKKKKQQKITEEPNRCYMNLFLAVKKDVLSTEAKLN